MPTYEYTCKKCHQNIEVFQPFSAKPLKKHADCGGDLQKVFHARGVVFKGSGFYATDSRKAPKDDSSSQPDTKPNGAKDSPAKKTESTKKAESAKPAAD
jgi:putative FmdB family regulatory protein